MCRKCAKSTPCQKDSKWAPTACKDCRSLVLGAYRDKLAEAGKALSSVKRYAGEKISRGHRVSLNRLGHSFDTLFLASPTTCKIVLANLPGFSSQAFLSRTDELAFSCLFLKPVPGSLRLSDLVRACAACAGNPGPKEAAIFFDAVLQSMEGKAVVWDIVARNFGESILLSLLAMLRFFSRPCSPIPLVFVSTRAV